MKKTILLSCHVPFYAYSKLGDIPWLDVWLTFHRGRKIEHFGPCFNSITTLERRIDELEEELASYEDPEDDCPNEYDEVRCLQDFRYNDDFCLIYESVVPGCPEIYLRTERLTRADLERGVACYLQTLGVTERQLRFKWKKPYGWKKYRMAIWPH